KHYKGLVPLVKSKDRAKETLRKYQTLRNHVINFLQFEFGVSDVPLSQLNYNFIEAFDNYLRVQKTIGNNTTVKYVQGFRRLMNLAVKYDWLIKDPFLLYDKKVKVKDAIFLTKEELQKLENIQLYSKRLEVVRDIFIFGCYTGYSPVDIHKLIYSDIVMGNDDQKWIMTKRTKTGIDCSVPLLFRAEKIIDKYRMDIYCLETTHILPKRSTQKMNMYLKEIAEIAEIGKNLHQYVARHTFACTVILANGLSMEVLSKMLGHTNLKQTMHYGKIQNARVGQEMKELRKKMNEKS
ncbi:MAG: site-specific integrase, partial [Flavobacteriales bacterium]|nr:site-specific integrase [Flavobacteriales bacterium]